MPTPWLDRPRKAGTKPASQICQQGGLLHKKKLVDSSLEAEGRWDCVKRYAKFLYKNTLTGLLRNKTTNKSLFWWDRPSHRSIRPLSQTTDTDSSPDGHSRLHKQILGVLAEEGAASLLLPETQNRKYPSVLRFYHENQKIRQESRNTFQNPENIWFKIFNSLRV